MLKLQPEQKLPSAKKLMRKSLRGNPFLANLIRQRINRAAEDPLYARGCASGEQKPEPRRCGLAFAAA